jgi:hypothetical protein
VQAAGFVDAGALYDCTLLNKAHDVHKFSKESVQEKLRTLAQRFPTCAAHPTGGLLGRLASTRSV